MRVLACASVVALAALAVADQLALTASEDNTLYESATGALSNGQGDGFFVGRVGPNGSGAIRRGLLAFDLSSIPSHATVLDAELRLECSAAVVVDSTIGFHRALADWGEGASVALPGGGTGAPAQPGDATWLHAAFPSSPWGASGGDFEPVASFSTVVGQTGGVVIQDPGLVADVQAWIGAPATNFGWCLVGDESAPSTAKRFVSRESTTVPHRPTLVVRFFSGIQTYCTGKVNGAGCLQQIGYGGTPSASSTSGFTVVALNARNQRPGLLAYTSAGRAAVPFAGGWRCIEAPVSRSVVVQAGGAPLPVNDCSGLLAIDMNAFASGALGGAPAPYLSQPGTLVNCQFWGRDPAFAPPDNLSLTDALEYLVGP